MKLFQHTAARRRLAARKAGICYPFIVSTHSRPKAAGRANALFLGLLRVSTHSRPKAAGTATSSNGSTRWFQHTAARRRLAGDVLGQTLDKLVSTHSRPKAAGRLGRLKGNPPHVSTHSRPKAAGPRLFRGVLRHPFQHTAARRRLDPRRGRQRCRFRFNTQPPEGGWKWR